MPDLWINPDPPDRWVNAVIEFVMPLDGTDPDASDFDKLRDAEDFYERMIEGLPEIPNLMTTIRHEVVVDGTPEKQLPEIERLRQALMDAGVSIEMVDAIQKGE